MYIHIHIGSIKKVTQMCPPDFLDPSRKLDCVVTKCIYATFTAEGRGEVVRYRKWSNWCVLERCVT